MSEPERKSCEGGISSLLARELPYMRRYARALTGSRAIGDEVIGEMLESLIEDPGLFPSDLKPRVAAYRYFQSIWRGEGGRRGATGPDHEILAREMMLLTTIEGFSADEAATILDVGPQEIAALNRSAIDARNAISAAKVMIIEDEPVIAIDLKMIVWDLGLETVGVATTHREAVALAAERRPDIVLADIQLADGSSGIEAVEEILQTQHAPVIFITAYPERLLTGEGPEPTYLLTKPYEEEQVRAAISQVLFHNSLAAA